VAVYWTALIRCLNYLFAIALPTQSASASYICAGQRHLPASSVDICCSLHSISIARISMAPASAPASGRASQASQPASQWPSIWAKHLKHLSQHLNGSSIWASICSSIWASISSISASIWPAHPCAARFGHLSRLLGRPSICFGRDHGGEGQPRWAHLAPHPNPLPVRTGRGSTPSMSRR
jgi:hypothetical protein